MNTASIKKHAPDAAGEYRYQHFTTGLLFRDLRFPKGAAAPGDRFPPFEVVTTDGERLVNRDLFGNKPVLLVFGSITCPMTASSAPGLRELYDEFGERVDFIMLYVREAHPGEHFTQTDIMEEKLEHARALQAFYEMPWIVAADNVAGDLHRALDPKPNAAYLMNSEGTILFRSLWAADQDALRQALFAATSGQVPAKQQSVALIGPVSRAMGVVQEVMERAGPAAVRDLWLAGFPMALAGRVATWFSPLSPDQRGVAAVLTLMFGTLVLLTLADLWIFS